MNTLLKQARSQKEQLHFRKALALYTKAGEQVLEEQDLLNIASMEAGLRHLKKAETLLKALQQTGSSSVSTDASLQLIHLYTQSSQLLKAQQIAADLLEQKKQKDLPALFWYSLGILRYEQGNLDDSLKMLNRALETAQERLRCETLIFLGDVWSAKGDYEQSVSSYQKALENLCAFPKNWRDLRKALILNNLADTFEQFEDDEQAARCYQEAWKALEEVKDQEIVDLEGCRMELLLSMANFHALRDEKDSVHELLESARQNLATIAMPVHLYWKSRIDYIDGLCDLYTENPLLDPFEKLFRAWKEQEQFLSLYPAASLEYLGRAAYYAAWCWNPAKAQGISQKQLYEQALDIFRASACKDPKFFLPSIASIENELGNLHAAEQSAKAFDWYEKSRQDYEQVLKRDPQDLFSAISLLAVLLNELQNADDLQLQEHAVSILDRFDSLLNLLRRDPDGAASVQDALGRLMENERLSLLFSERLEQLHERYGHLDA